MLLVKLFDSQPRLEMREQVGTGHEAPDKCEIGFFVERFDEHLEGLIPIIGTEIAEAGVCPGPVDQGALVERNHAFQIEAPAFLVDFLYPLRPFWRLPTLDSGPTAVAHLESPHIAIFALPH